MGVRQDLDELDAMDQKAKKQPKVGDIIMYMGYNNVEVGIVKDVGLDGLVRVQSGDYRRTVAPFDFMQVFKGTDETITIARNFDR